MDTMCFPAARFSHRRPLGLTRIRAGGVSVCCVGVTPAPMGEKTKYRDGVIEKAFMGLFGQKMEKYAGGGRSRRGVWDWDYESFVEVSRRVMVGRSRSKQQEVVREVLLSMLPPGAPAQFRKLFPPTKWAAEFNAALTVPFFHWLVGPSEVIEVEVNGRRQRSGVRIKKCRYLESSGCVGMCVNMCKIPTQDFFTKEFGLPLTMNPSKNRWFMVIRMICSTVSMLQSFLYSFVMIDIFIEPNLNYEQFSASFFAEFEDMSCEMLYGQAPPPFEDDPVSKQPCYANLCSLANPSTPLCHNLQN